MPLETTTVVDAMVEAVNADDPLFFRGIEDRFRSSRRSSGARCRSSTDPGSARAFVREFDADLGPLRTKIVDWSQAAERSVAPAVRTVLGVTRDR